MITLLRDRHGATALEFSLIALLFLFLLFAIIDLGRYGITQLSLNTVASDASRSLIINCGGPLNSTCTTVTLPATESGLAPFAYAGGSPTIQVLANTGSQTITITVTAAQPFTALLPLFSGLDGNLSATTTLSYCSTGFTGCS